MPAHYLFNHVNRLDMPELCPALLRAGMWGVEAGEHHADALAPGDLVLIYLAAPRREFVAHAELASASHDWSPSEARRHPGCSFRGVLLARVHEWTDPVPMAAVLPRMDPADKARADFDAGVVRITASEYRTVLTVAEERSSA
jgi:hypothetical protein